MNRNIRAMFRGERIPPTPPVRVKKKDARAMGWGRVLPGTPFLFHPSWAMPGIYIKINSDTAHSMGDAPQVTITGNPSCYPPDYVFDPA